MKFRKQSDTFVAYLVLAVGVFCIAWSAIFVKFAGVNGPVSAFYRLLVALIVLIPLQLCNKTKSISRSDIFIVSTGGALFAADLVLWNTSLLFTSAASSTLLAYNAPLWVGLASVVFFKERLSRSYWLGLATSLSGMTILLGIWSSLRQLSFNKGDLLAIAASFFYAGYFLLTQSARARVDTLTFMTISVSTGFVLLFAFNLILKSRLTGFTGKTWASLIALGLVTHLGGWFAINYAMGHLRAAPVTVSMTGQGVVTAILSIPLLGEGLSSEQIIGGILVIVGIYLANRPKIHDKNNICKKFKKPGRQSKEL